LIIVYVDNIDADLMDYFKLFWSIKDGQFSCRIRGLFEILFIMVQESNLDEDRGYFHFI
jgi:hypothetical protein